MRPPLSEQTATELEKIRLRMLEMLVPLVREGPSSESGDAAQQELREVLWSAAHSLYPLLRDYFIPAGVNLDQEDEATWKSLYDFVVWDYFTPRTLEDSGDINVPRHMPEECGLKVFFEYGRWFVTWLNLEEDSNQPEAIRRELFVFDKDKDGNLYLAEV